MIKKDYLLIKYALVVREFGCDDFPEKEEAFNMWCLKWIEEGCKWFSRNPPPNDWNGKEQLKKLNINCL